MDFGLSRFGFLGLLTMIIPTGTSSSIILGLYHRIIYVYHIWLVVWLPFFIFPYIGNNHPNWRSYFSEGFKPPTRYCYTIILGFSKWAGGAPTHMMQIFFILKIMRNRPIEPPGNQTWQWTIHHFEMILPVNRETSILFQDFLASHVWWCQRVIFDGRVL